MKWTEHQAFRFLVAGGANTIFGYGMYLLFNLMLDYRVSYTLSFVIGIFVSFVLNSLYVFRQPLRWGRLVVYPTVYLIQYIVGVACVWIFVGVFHQSEVFAPIPAIVISLPLTYVATRFIIKGKPNVATKH